MRILTYQELEHKSSLLPLLEQAFGWPFDALDFEKTIKVDPRLKDGCVGFCALDEGKVLGYVGVMDLATRAVNENIENVGGIYGVATLPGHARQGICTALMKRAHEYFIEKDYRFSFLTTSPTIVAYALYEKLGYFTVISFPSAYKTKEKMGRQRTPEREKASKLDFDKMLRIHHEYVKSKTGLVVRDQTYMKMLVKANEIATKECITTQRGYVIFKKEKTRVRIRELIAQDQKEMDRLIGLIEDKAQNMVYARAVLDPILRQVYESRGFTVLGTGHGVLMAKELTTDASFSKTYGNRFYMTALDHF